ncbi:MAG: hypothetical protein ACPG5B_11005 [Chitinophagales bacterium]
MIIEKKVGGKLLFCLKSLTKKELNAFMLYVESPFFNKNKTLVKLCHVLIDLYPNLDQVLEVQLFDAVFENEVFNYSKLRNLLSDLNKLFKNFLAISYLQKQKTLIDLFYIEQLNEKQLDNFLIKDVKLFNKKIKKQFYQTEKDFAIQFRLSEIIYQKAIFNRKRDVPNALQELMNDADKHYLYVKLRYFFAGLNQQAMQNIQYDFWLFEEVLAALEKNGNTYLEEAPILKIYYHFILLLKEIDDEKHFIASKKYLHKNQLYLSLSEQRNFYTILTNYCYWANNKFNEHQNSNTNYLAEAFELYKKGFEDKIWYVNGKFSPHHFRNMVKIALQNKKIDWTEYFIKKYKCDIEERYASIIVILSSCHSLFFQAKFQEASKTLAQIEIESHELIDSYDNIAYRLMSIKVYFEMLLLHLQKMVYVNFIFDKIEAFRIYLLRNKKIAESIKVENQNFVNICKRFINVVKLSPLDVKKIKALKEDMTIITPLAEREWLNQKIAYLLSK